LSVISRLSLLHILSLLIPTLEQSGWWGVL
jgi:hypothetical protein